MDAPYKMVNPSKLAMEFDKKITDTINEYVFHGQLPAFEAIALLSQNLGALLQLKKQASPKIPDNIYQECIKLNVEEGRKQLMRLIAKDNGCQGTA